MGLETPASVSLSPDFPSAPMSLRLCLMKSFPSLQVPSQALLRSFSSQSRPALSPDCPRRPLWEGPCAEQTESPRLCEQPSKRLPGSLGRKPAVFSGLQTRLVLMPGHPRLPVLRAGSLFVWLLPRH